MIYKIAFRKPAFWFAFHFLLGIGSALSKFVLIAWFYIMIIQVVALIANQKDRKGIIFYALAYFLPFEVWARMAKTTPFIPYETGKYLIVSLLILGLAFKSRVKMNAGGWLLILSLPAFFAVPWSYDFFRFELVYNYFGFLALCLAVLYFKGKVFSERELTGVMRLMLMGVVSILGYLFLKTPRFDEMTFNLSANFQSTGGFGPNQVSTILGIGIPIFSLAYLLRLKVTPGKVLTGLVLSYLLYRGLLTFSRGGMVAGVMAALLPWLYLLFIGKLKFKYLITGVLGVFIMLMTVLFVNAYTEGALFFRYMGQTSGTLAGHREHDFNTVTSGRVEISKSDLEIFSRHPILGAGPGQSKNKRKEAGDRGVATHTEITRMPAEHGVFGIVMALIFLFFPVYMFYKTKNRAEKMWMLAFFSIAILSSMHSATRTIITPLTYGLATIKFVPGAIRYRVFRKQTPEEGSEPDNDRHAQSSTQ